MTTTVESRNITTLHITTFLVGAVNEIPGSLEFALWNNSLGIKNSQCDKLPIAFWFPSEPLYNGITLYQVQ